jgi:hypothetical protein
MSAGFRLNARHAPGMAARLAFDGASLRSLGRSS